MSQGHVLILDDDPAVGETVGFIGREMGFATEAFTDPVAFFARLDDITPSHIVLDLIMPKMDGVEVMHSLAQRGCPAQLIISSGVGGRVLDAAYRTAREHGLPIAGVLSKPFSPTALKNFLGRAQARPEPRPVDGSPVPKGSIAVDEESILLGIQNREFDVVFQPILACATETVTGFEALARWKHPSGVIMPDRFIPVAESLGLIDQITRQVLERAMSWIAASYRSRRWALSVNISATSLGSKPLADRLESMCRAAELNPKRLILEVTETAAMDEPVTALEILTRLRMKGFDLSIDDFGTGYSSLAQLARMPFSELKVDKSFVLMAGESAESRTIIHSIVDLGHNLGLRVVAEGVEDEQTLAFLKHAGCDLVQGYHFARPMEGGRVQDWVLKNYGVKPEV